MVDGTWRLGSGLVTYHRGVGRMAMLRRLEVGSLLEVVLRLLSYDVFAATRWKSSTIGCWYAWTKAQWDGMVSNIAQSG